MAKRGTDHKAARGTYNVDHHSQKLVVAVTEEMAVAFQRLANQKGLTKSDLLRELVTEALKNG